LDKGSTPQMPNEDDPNIMVVMTPAAGNDGGTYKTLSK
jgi:hypothetical protein